MKNLSKLLTDDSGSVMIPAILILALLTIIVFSAMNISNVEKQVSTNALLHQRTFYAAESGLHHSIKLLEDPFVQANAVNVVAGSDADWDFALQAGPNGPIVAATEDAGNPPHGFYEGGAIWIQNGVIDGINYTVTLWNNQEQGGNFENDEDGRVWIQSDAQDPRGSRSSIRVLLAGDATGVAITGYTAQAGGGAGKNYNANDVDPITDFSSQL